MNKPKDPLDDLLGTWKPRIEIPADFKRQIWRRIEAEERSSRSWWFVCQVWVGRLLSPAFATAMLVLALMTGSAIAYCQARLTNQRNLQELQTRYIASIDPYYTR